VVNSSRPSMARLQQPPQRSMELRQQLHLKQSATNEITQLPNIQKHFVF
jgi:hypothetical protein